MLALFDSLTKDIDSHYTKNPMMDCTQLPATKMSRQDTTHDQLVSQSLMVSVGQSVNQLMHSSLIFVDTEIKINPTTNLTWETKVYVHHK